MTKTPLMNSKRNRGGQPNNNNKNDGRATANYVNKLANLSPETTYTHYRGSIISP